VVRGEEEEKEKKRKKRKEKKEKRKRKKMTNEHQSPDLLVGRGNGREGEGACILKVYYLQK